MNELRARLETPSGSEWVRRAAWAVLAAAFLAFVVRGGSSPADPYLAEVERRPLEGFGEIAFTVTDPSGSMAEWCAMLAETDAQRQQGLMGQRDLRGYDGMIFRYPEPIAGSFWMRGTLIPLAVAFFDAEGRYVGAQGMEPCPDEVADADCPRYPSPEPFTVAIEVERGGLGAIGIGEGSMLTLGGSPCP